MFSCYILNIYSLNIKKVRSMLPITVNWTMRHVTNTSLRWPLAMAFTRRLQRSVFNCLTWMIIHQCSPSCHHTKSSSSKRTWTSRVSYSKSTPPTGTSSGPTQSFSASTTTTSWMDQLSDRSMSIHTRERSFCRRSWTGTIQTVCCCFIIYFEYKFFQ